MLILPDGKQLSDSEVFAHIDDYARKWPCVFELYDLPDAGPHDDVRPIDLLALNALNAWGSGQPMTWMSNAWPIRDQIARAIAPISHKQIEELDDSAAAEQAVKVGAALDMVNGIKGFGETVTPKFLHRLRPNLSPIWDKWIGTCYPDCKRKSWAVWVQRVYDDVRERDTQRCLMAARDRLGLPLSLLRVWDMLLWQRYRGAAAPS